MPTSHKNTFRDSLKRGILRSTCAVLRGNYENYGHKSELPHLQEEDWKDVAQGYCF